MLGDTPVSTVVPATTPVKTTSSFLDKFNAISNQVIDTASGVANTIGLFKNNGTSQPYTSNPSAPKKTSALKWWLIGGGVAAAITTVVLVVRKKKKKKSLAGTPRKAKKSRNKKS